MQVLVPVSTTAAGDWVGYPSGDPHAAIDEAARDDNDRAQTDLWPSGDQPLIVKLTTPTQPLRVGAKVKYAIGTTRDPKTVWVKLYCGNVQIHEWTHANVTTTGEFSQTLTAPDIIAINACVDPYDLYLHFMGGGGVIHNVGVPERLRVRELPETDYENPAASGDFNYRRNLPGTLRSFDFSNADQLGTVYFGNPAYDPNHELNVGIDHGQKSSPVIDSVMQCEGVNSVRFEIQSETADDPGGGWTGCFGPNETSFAAGAKQIGVGQSFCCQVRFRINSDLFNTIFMDAAWTAVGAATYISPTSLSIAGDHTDIYIGSGYGGILRTRNSTPGQYTYAAVVSSNYSGGVTTFQLQVLNGSAIDATLTQVDRGFTQGALKLLDFTAGRLLNGALDESGPSNDPNSSSDLKLVNLMRTGYQWFPSTYHKGYATTLVWDALYGPGYSGLANAGVCAFVGGLGNLQNYVDAYYQTEMPDPFCYTGSGNPNPPGTLLRPGCARIYPDEWMTARYYLEIFNRRTEHVAQDAWDVRYRVWLAREGEASILIHDFHPAIPALGLSATPGYYPLHCGTLAQDQRYGRWWVFPTYMTGKDGTQVHPTGKVWISQFIIREGDIIPDPSILPLWRRNKSIGALYEFTGSEYASDYAFKEPTGASNGANNFINPWNTMCNDATRLIGALNGGHSNSYPVAWQNPILAFDLSQDAPAWATLDAGSDFNTLDSEYPTYPIGHPSLDDAGSDERYPDGRYCSRHTYQSVQFVPSGKFADGHASIVLVGCYGAWAMDFDGPVPPLPPEEWPAGSGFGKPTYAGGPECIRFDLVTNQWLAQGTLPPIPYAHTQHTPGTCTDPDTGNIYICSDNIFTRFTPANNQWTILIEQTKPNEPLGHWGDRPTVYDTIRDRVVGLLYLYRGGNPAPAAHLEYIPEGGPYTMSSIPISGALTSSSDPDTRYGRMIHDTDRDLYAVVGSIGGTPYLFYINPETGASTQGPQLHPKAGSPILNYFPQYGVITHQGQYQYPMQFIPTR